MGWRLYLKKAGGNIRQGYLRFNTQQVIDGLNFLKGLSDVASLVFHKSYNEQFGSGPYLNVVKRVLTISSSAGLRKTSQQSVDYLGFDVSVHPIPYKDVDKRNSLSHKEQTLPSLDGVQKPNKKRHGNS